MVYLINQRCADVEMEYVVDADMVSKIEDAKKNDELVSALDSVTAKKLSAKLPFEVSEFEADDFQGASINDLPITLPDTLDLGDEIIAIEEHGSFLMCYVYTEYGE